MESTTQDTRALFTRLETLGVELAPQSSPGRTSPAAVKAFHTFLYDFYKGNKRPFPWRSTRNAYHILVSEMMLQQTQTARVVEKLKEFTTAFPDVRSLAAAAPRDVLAAWQGLGYNRRALSLQKAAELIVERHNGIVPRSLELLDDLPGIGRPTAAAIMAYAFNVPELFIETNIRTVFIHLFFKDRETVSDKEIEQLLEIFLDRKNPRQFYNALMDLGVEIKRLTTNPSRKSARHRPQSQFEGSNRQLRGAILRLLLRESTLDAATAAAALEEPRPRVKTCLEQLADEGFLTKSKSAYSLK